MLRLSRQGAGWRATDGQRVATGRSRIDALHAFDLLTQANTLEQPRRWVVYVATGDDLLTNFADAVMHAGRPWKPVAIDPLHLPDVLSCLHPDAVVIATPERTETLAPRTQPLDGGRIVVDGTEFTAVSDLLCGRRWDSPITAPFMT